MNNIKNFDITIVGGGVLGTSLAYWLSNTNLNLKIAIIEQEKDIAIHSTGRNTGVYHSPFYLDPIKKKRFASAAYNSYYLWKKLAIEHNLPWKEWGTLEIAQREEDLKEIDKYAEWAIKNGLKENDFKLLSKNEIKEIEPHAIGEGAFFSVKDSSVDYKIMTEKIMDILVRNGVRLITGYKVKNIYNKSDKLNVYIEDHNKNKIQIFTSLMFNTAGGESLKIAHKMGFAKNFAQLNFRGDYWIVKDKFPYINTNIYTIPKHSKFPFLDPHFIKRYNGLREIGPNASLVYSPYSYEGDPGLLKSILYGVNGMPLYPKLKLLTNKDFMNIVKSEWRSSINKTQMCNRVSSFLPELDSSYLSGKGTSGIRSPLISKTGFVSDATIIKDEYSIHILNYNSPGASGAPAFSFGLIQELINEGFFKKREVIYANSSIWNTDDIVF